MWVQSLGWEDPLEESMATHSSLLTWRIPSTEEPGAQEQRESYLVYYPEYFFNWERRGKDTNGAPNVTQIPAIPFNSQSPMRCIRTRSLNVRR